MPTSDPRCISTELSVSEEFLEGRHGIARVGCEFERRFHALSFVPLTANSIIELPLPRDLTDKEILVELNPLTATLSDFFVALHSRNLWPWSIWYIRDTAE